MPAILLLYRPSPHDHNKNKMQVQILLLLMLCSTLSSSGNPEVDALLRFKSFLVLPSPDPLSNWVPTSPIHSWSFVFFEDQDSNHVTSIQFQGLGLSGTIDVDSLSALTNLRKIEIIHNKFTGPIPDFTRLPDLDTIYLSKNGFTGPIPDNYFTKLVHIQKIWLDGNNFTGPIPTSLAKGETILEINLGGNHFSGPLPDFTMPNLKVFDVSGNLELTGKIPDSLSRFPEKSFKGSSGLCGPPVKNPCSNPPPPPPPNSSVAGGGDDSNSNSNSSSNSNTNGEVSAGQSESALPPPKKEEKEEKKGGSGFGIVIFAIVGGVVIIGLLAVAFRKKKRKGEFGRLGIDGDADAMEAAATVDSSQKHMAVVGGSTRKRGDGSSRGGSRRGGGGSLGGPNLVMVNNDKGVFGLPDLMKAAAEVLGNGGLGSAYKAVMSNGLAVAVKRMKELNRVGRDVFDGEMRRHGRLRHKNVLPPLAYLYRREEKLVVSEYISKGSLLYILHGDRGADHAALDWFTRLKIIRGVAKGMSFLHSELSTLDVPHANLKSSNILLTPDYEPLIVDYGFIGLVNPSQASNFLFAYKTPEAMQHRHVSPKSDVYCLGVLILEILTGKYPSQYLNNDKGGTDVVQWTASAVSENREEELIDPNIASAKSSMEDMVKLLRVGTACTEPSLEDRPSMKEAEEMVEEVARSCVQLEKKAPV